MVIINSKAYKSGKWHYEARLLMGSWQPAARVAVDMSDANADVVVDTDSFQGAREITSNDRGFFQVELHAEQGALNSFFFAFTVIGGQLNMHTPPQVACVLTRPLVAIRPSPPPPPPMPFGHSPPPSPAGIFRKPTQQCVLGGKIYITNIWNGGTSFRGGLVLAIWKPGAEVTLDFSADTRYKKKGVPNIEVSHAINAVALSAPHAGAIRFQLAAFPDGTNGFTFVGHNGEINRNPVISCVLRSEMILAPPPPRVAAIIGPTCAPLGLSYSLLQKWNGGFKAVVAVRSWQPGATVALRYDSQDAIQLLDVWSASRTGGSDDSAIAVVLGDTPDAEHHGFGFTARGMGSSVERPALVCELDASALALMPVARSACGMGAAHAVKVSVDAPDTYAVRVRLSQWQAGATVTVTFDVEVETQGDATFGDVGEASAAESSHALGSEHIFVLGPHPDGGHGFSFKVHAAGMARITKLTCRPRSLEDAAAEPVAKPGVPEAPVGLKAHSPSCDAVTLTWHPAVDNGYSVSGYRVYYRRREASDAAFDIMETDKTSASLNALSGGTTYFIKVRARNVNGDGHYSERATVTTQSGGTPRSAPDRPEPEDSPDCHSLTFKLPSLRGGCRGDSFFALQLRGFVGGFSSAWSDVVAMVADASVTARDLDPNAVYQFRLVPHNSRGVGPASESTSPVMVAALAQVLAAPTVRSVSSASFSISWSDVAGACRSSLRWRISYAPAEPAAANGTDGLQWSMIASGIVGGTHLAYPLRCRPPGCLFRVQSGSASATGIYNWAQPSTPSTPVASLPLPAAPPGSVRLELQLRSEHRDLDTLQMSIDAANDVSSSLRLPLDAVVVREIYGAGQYIVLDLLEASQNRANAETGPDSLAQQLALLSQQLIAGQSGGLASGRVTYDVASVLLITADGRTTPVRVGPDANSALARIPRWHGDGSRFVEVESAKMVTVSVAVAALLMACCCRINALMERGRAATAGYDHVANEEKMSGFGADTRQPRRQQRFAID